MKKQTIVKTAVCRWSEEEQVFIVQSPLYDLVLGAGDTPGEAWKIYYELLDDMWESYLDGTLHEKSRPGRPAKGIVSVGVQVTPEIKEALKRGANGLGISQGDFVSFGVRAAESLLTWRDPKPESAMKLKGSISSIFVRSDDGSLKPLKTSKEAYKFVEDVQRTLLEIEADSKAYERATAKAKKARPYKKQTK